MMWISLENAALFMRWYLEYIDRGGSLNDQEALNKAVPILRHCPNEIRDVVQVREYIISRVDPEKRNDRRLSDL